MNIHERREYLTRTAALDFLFGHDWTLERKRKLADLIGVDHRDIRTDGTLS